MRLEGVRGGVEAWLILCPGCRRDLGRLSHCRQRVVECLDGAAGLEGRFRKIESCDESLFVHLVMMIADGGVLVWRGRVLSVAVGETNQFLPVAMLRCVIFSLLLMVWAKSGCAWAEGGSEVGNGQYTRLGGRRLI